MGKYVCVGGDDMSVGVTMKVGDLVKWESVLNDSIDVHTVEYGIVTKMSRTGHTTESAQVLFNDGETAWFDTKRLVVVSGGP